MAAKRRNNRKAECKQPMLTVTFTNHRGETISRRVKMSETGTAAFIAACVNVLVGMAQNLFQLDMA